MPWCQARRTSRRQHGKRAWAGQLPTSSRALHLNTHVQRKDTQTHTPTEQESSYRHWTNSPSDGNVLRMLSCPLRKWDSQPPLSPPSDSRGPLTITGKRTTRLPGDTNQLAAWKKRDCQGIVSTARGMTDRRLEGVLWLGTLTQPRESTLCLDGSFFFFDFFDLTVVIWTGCWMFEQDEMLNMRKSHTVSLDTLLKRI